MIQTNHNAFTISKREFFAEGKKMMSRKFALFDFDGVIADTENSNAAYLQKALSYWAIKLTEEDKRALIGTKDGEYINRVLSRASCPISQEDLRERRSEVGNTYENGKLCAECGIKKLIDYLREQGIKTALVSSTSAKLIITALNRLKMMDMFDVIVCGDMCAAAKPNPEGYKKAMEYLGANPEECGVVEDSKAGILAGKQAGAYVIAYTGGSIEHDVREADCQIKSFINIEEIIKNFRQID